MPFASWPLYANSTKQKNVYSCVVFPQGFHTILHIFAQFFRRCTFTSKPLALSHFLSLFCGEHGWCIGESSRLAPIWAGFRSWFVGWVCCWFSPLLWEVFSPVTLVFSLKTNTSKCRFDLNAQTLLKEFLRTSKHPMGKQITILFIIIFTFFDIF